MSFLSLTAPAVEGWKDQARVDIVRRVNDYGADLVRQEPKHFGYLATLALPDISAGLSEIKRSYDELKVDGLVLHSNYGGIYLADPHFDPVWAELERRSAIVFIHPTRPLMPVLKGMPSPLLDYPADTTRCAVDLIFNRHLERFPSAKIILSHGGGYLPFVADRVAELTTTLSNGLSAENIMECIKKFTLIRLLLHQVVCRRFSPLCHRTTSFSAQIIPMPPRGFVKCSTPVSKTLMNCQRSSCTEFIVALASCFHGYETAPRA